MTQTPTTARWRPPHRLTGWALSLRAIGLVMLVGAFFVQGTWLAWLSLAPLLMVWLTGYGRRSIYLRNLSGLPCLDINDELPELE